MQKTGKNINRVGGLKRAMALSVLCFLNACSVYRTDFECDPVNGLSCKSLSQINNMHENGKMDKKPSSTSSLSEESQHKDSTSEPLEAKLPQKFLSGKMTRSPEKVQRVWIAGYEDKDGVYHGPKYMYMVVQKGHWVPTLDVGDKI